MKRIMKHISKENGKKKIKTVSGEINTMKLKDIFVLTTKKWKASPPLYGTKVSVS